MRSTRTLNFIVHYLTNFVKVEFSVEASQVTSQGNQHLAQGWVGIEEKCALQVEAGVFAVMHFIKAGVENCVMVYGWSMPHI